MHLLRKINEVGIKNTVVGACKNLYFRSLMKKYGFESCHLSAYELRKYLQAVAEYVNQHMPVENEVIDVGCGLGGLLRNIKAPKRTGIDLSPEAIECAKYLDKTNSITFKSGTFPAIGEGHDIDYLISLGFMHGGHEEDWKGYFDVATANNNINNIIVDVFKEDPATGSHKLDFTKVLPAEYKLIDRSGPFLGEKYVEVYSKL